MFGYAASFSSISQCQSPRDERSWQRHQRAFDLSRAKRTHWKTRRTTPRLMKTEKQTTKKSHAESSNYPVKFHYVSALFLGWGENVAILATARSLSLSLSFSLSLSVFLFAFRIILMRVAVVQHLSSADKLSARRRFRMFWLDYGVTNCRHFAYLHMGKRKHRKRHSRAQQPQMQC